MPNRVRERLAIASSNLLAEIKSKASTYGEARRLLSDMEWDTQDEVQLLVIQRARKKLESEMGELPIKKKPSGNLA